MKKERIKELEWAADLWDKSALSAGTESAKETSRRAAESLRIQIRTGDPVCVCCYKPFKDMTKQDLDMFIKIVIEF